MSGFSTKFATFLTAFARDQRGATAIEYALIVSGIFVAIVLTVYDMASTLNVMYNKISDKVDEAVL